MQSYLLHGLPTEYKGMVMRTDWRVGVSLTLLFQSNQITDPGVLEYAYRLLYPRLPDDASPDIMMQGLSWFLSLGESDKIYLDKQSNPAKEQQLDFIEDQFDIMLWLRQGYNIDILDHKYDSLHWFLFMSMVMSAHNCPLAEKLKMRGVDLSKIKDKEIRKGYSEGKQLLKVHKIVDKNDLTPEIEEALDRAINGDYIAKVQLQAMGLNVDSED